MTKPTNTDAIERATARSWAEWLVFLQSNGAAQLSHRDIAALVNAEPGVSGWWAQTIAVAYEQQIGRRLPGQASTGTFSVSVSKTVAGTLDEVMSRWVAYMADRDALSNVALRRGPTVSETDHWRYWHCSLDDGSRVSVHLNEKETGKVALGVQHDKLASEVHREHWRGFWKNELGSL